MSLSQINDCSAVKSAIDDGGTYRSGKIRVGGVDKFLSRTNVGSVEAPHYVWDLDTAGGFLLTNLAAFNQMKNNNLTTAQGEYQFCFVPVGGGPEIGYLGLDEITNTAKIFDPYPAG